MRNSLVVLAAGIGSRYGGLKQLEKLGPNGETLIDYSIYNAIKAGYSAIVMVIRKETEEVIKNFFKNKVPSDLPFYYVFQELDAIPAPFTVPPGRVKPWGTGHALMLCEEHAQGGFTMINGDDYYAYEALKLSHDFLASSNLNSRQYLNLGYKLINTLSSHGTVSRGVCEINKDNKLTDLVEHKKIQYLEDGSIHSITENETASLAADAIASMNLMSFTPTIFPLLREGMQDFLTHEMQDIKAEFLVPAYLGTLSKAGRVSIQVIQTDAKWYGITYQEDTQRVKEGIQALIEAGELPAKIWK